MKSLYSKLIVLAFALVFYNDVSAQVGIAKTAISLQDNSFVGSLWKPDGTVNYTEEKGAGVYGLVISMNTSDEYLDIYEGHKVSIEYTDESREILEIIAAPTSYDNTVINHRVVDIYQRRILIYPNFENLTTKEIKRIVIQRTNGKVWIIETKPKWAKKLPNEFAKAMQEALESYRIRVSNNNYFEDIENNDSYFEENTISNDSIQKDTIQN